MEGSFNQDGEAHLPASGASSRKRGGWITFPFLIGTMCGLSLAGGGCMTNLVVYLIDEFNMKSMDAVQINNVINGCATILPIIGAIIADSYIGLFPLISISSLISLLGIVLLTLTATLNSLRPPRCEKGSPLCKSPSSLQLAVLYAGLALLIIGGGGTDSTLETMGVNQFDKTKHQANFINWSVFATYSSFIVSATGIIFIEDQSWGLGFGICIAANLLGLAIFLVGKRYYRVVKPQGSPITALARVVAAALRKRKAPLSLESEDYYQEYSDAASKMVGTIPTKNFKFLNRAALKETGDTKADGSIAKPWNLCTVQQVEDFKSLIRIFPILSSAIFLSIPIAIHGSLFVLQARTMDRHLGANGFKIPTMTTVIFIELSACFSLVFIDRCLFPVWQKFKGHPPTPLQRIGAGHVLIILSMAASAIVESKRLKIAHSSNFQKNSTVPMSVFWLMPPMALVGAGEAFHFPGQVGLYYQEFPASLKSTSTAIAGMLIAIAYYMGTAILAFVRRTTGWLPDDINTGRVDNLFWMLVMIGMLNYGYFLACARLYKYQNVEQKLENDASDPQG